jgi:hypothetical protein
MATAVTSIRRPARMNPDRVFYPIMCGLILITVWLGFSKTYYAVGMVRAKLPSAVVHVHAVVATLWLVTLVVQIALVSARKVKLHMALGLWGFGLAAVMVVLGLLTARDGLIRGMTPDPAIDPRTFFIVPVSGILLFGVLVGWSYMVRRRPVEHKRLIMIATITIMDAAIGRFPFTLGHIGPVGMLAVLFSFLLLMVLYDVVTQRKVLRVTWVSSLAVVVVMLVRFPIGQTHAWIKFAELVRG